jgi:hypothetical protein
VPRNHRKPHRIALPAGAVLLGARQVIDGESTKELVPIKYWDIYNDWIRGTPIQTLVAESDLLIKEIDDVLRQCVVEKLANTKKNRREKTGRHKEEES